MAWSIVDFDTSSVNTTGGPGGPTRRIETLSLASFGASIAVGDVVVVGARSLIEQSRPSQAETVNAAVTLTMEALTGVDTVYEKTIGGDQSVWVFQVTDAGHAAETTYEIAVEWTPTTDFGDGTYVADRMFAHGGVTTFRSDTNPTWPVWVERPTASGMFFPAGALTTGFEVYTHVAFGPPGTLYSLKNPVPYTQSWKREDTFNSQTWGIGLSWSSSHPGATDPDWETEYGYGLGAGAAPPTACVAPYWKAYDPTDPPVIAPADPFPSKCLIHIPHKEWLAAGDRATQKRQIEANWHELESWAARVLTDDGCRPCLDYLTTPT